MTTIQALVILLQSNFQVKFYHSLLDWQLEQKDYTEAQIRKAIETLNEKKVYSFIRKLDENTNPIL